MKDEKLKLIDEQQSPLVRIMFVNNLNEPARKQFDNNICAFHVGNGVIISVAHNLRTESKVLKIIENSVYQTDILPHLNPTQTQLLNKCYQLDTNTNKRYINIKDEKKDTPKLIELFKQINFDTRWITLMKNNIYKPYLIVQFNDNKFYEDTTLTGHFNTSTFFSEPNLNRHTFLIELELVDPMYSEDFSIYKIVNTHQDVIDKLPNIKVDFPLLDDTEKNLFCLQSAPGGVLGRLLNNARIEGLLDTWSIFIDRIGGNYTFEGHRYLIKGYFRFGSSGAPYVVYDETERIFKVNAIQSEASPIQLSIKNNREGNFQYVNAIASPLKNIESKLSPFLTTQTT